MFLLTIRKKFIGELTLVGLVLTVLVGAIFHLFMSDKAYLYFSSIPIFFYLIGLFYISMFSFYYRLGLDKLVVCYLVCKVMKFIVSALFMVVYAYFIKVDVVEFLLTFIFFFFAFLIFETRFFLLFETKLKYSKQLDNEKNTVHSIDSVDAGGVGTPQPGDGC